MNVDENRGRNGSILFSESPQRRVFCAEILKFAFSKVGNAAYLTVTFKVAVKYAAFSEV